MNHSAKSPKRPWWKNGWVVGILLVLFLQATGTLVYVQAALQRVILTTGLLRPDAEPVDKRVPADLELRLVDASGAISTLADHRGEVLFINFWATWCAPCIAEMPSINAVFRDRGDRVRFFLVATDDTRERAQAFMDSRGFELPLYQLAGPMTKTFRMRTIPSTWVIDREGRVAVREQGMAAYDTGRFRQMLDALVAEPVRDASNAASGTTDTPSGRRYP